MGIITIRATVSVFGRFNILKKTVLQRVFIRGKRIREKLREY